MLDFLQEKTTMCQDQNIQIDEVEEEDDVEFEQDHPAQFKTFIPSFHMLMHGIKNLTMAIPKMHAIEGFRFSIGTPLSQNFMVAHEFNLDKPGEQPSPQMMMMGMGQQRNPFYQLTAQYHHGHITQEQQNILFSLLGIFNSNGDVNAIFTKSLGAFNIKFQSQFHEGPERYINSAELVHRGKTMVQTFTLSSQASEYSIVQKLGKKLLIGCSLGYLPMYQKLNTGYSCRLVRNPFERYYFQYQTGIQNVLSFGSIFKLDQFTQVASELEFGGEKFLPRASFGYRRKLQTYEVANSIKTNGTIKTLFTYMHNQFFKLQFYLQGNLFKDQFKSGYAFSVGQVD